MNLPKLNSYVYVITYVDSYPYCVTKDRVYMKNEDEFITEEMLDDCVITEYRIPLSIDNYGEAWVKTFKEVKETLKKIEQEKFALCGEKLHFYLRCKCDDHNWNVDYERT